MARYQEEGSELDLDVALRPLIDAAAEIMFLVHRYGA